MKFYNVKAKKYMLCHWYCPNCRLLKAWTDSFVQKGSTCVSLQFKEAAIFDFPFAVWSDSIHTRVCKPGYLFLNPGFGFEKLQTRVRVRVWINMY